MSNITKYLQRYNERPKRLITYIGVSIIITAIILYSAIGIEYRGVTSRGSNVAFGIIHGIFNPNTEILFSSAKDAVPYLVLETIGIAVLGTIIGAIISVPIAFLGSNLLPPWLSYIFRSLVLGIRTIPSLVWALIWIRVVGPGATCGIITQSITSIGMISKLYITAIEDIDKNILESLDAVGCNTFEKIRYGIIPQLTASFISAAIYRFDINIKDASVLGIVGAGGIGAPMLNAINSRRWPLVGSFLLVIIIVVIFFEFLSTKIRKKLARG